MAAPMADLTVKWSGNEYKISGLLSGASVLEFKQAIHNITGVLPARQKLLGLKYKGKLAADDILLSELKLKPTTKIMMMGTKEEQIQEVMEAPTDIPDVVNDLDFEEEEIAIENREEYINKVERRIKEYKLEIINEPRPDKKLLVLDIDYTLFDHKSVGETGRDLMRPFLHEFLTSAYEHYDIAIWCMYRKPFFKAATSMKWIKAKMEELGVMQHSAYKLCFFVDSLAMITIDTPKYGVIEVKPLGVIWGKFDQWDKTNTIMFDDLRRNFIMNPQNGLKIRPFANAHTNRGTDRELLKLAEYLRAIACLPDLTILNHRRWEKYERHKHKRHKSNQPAENDGSPGAGTS